MKKDPGLLIVAAGGIILIVWRCSIAIQETRKAVRDHSLVRLAIDNAESVTVVAGSKTCVLTSTSDPDVVSSIFRSLDSPAIPPPAEHHEDAQLLLSRGNPSYTTTVSYYRATGLIGANDDGPPQWFRLPEPARDRIAAFVAKAKASTVRKRSDK